VHVADRLAGLAIDALIAGQLLWQRGGEHGPELTGRGMWTERWGTMDRDEFQRYLATQPRMALEILGRCLEEIDTTEGS
jgi:hypothetical protein